MYGIEVVIDEKTGDIVINVDQKELINQMGKEIAVQAKAQEATAEQLHAGYQTLLKTKVRFGVIKN